MGEHTTFILKGAKGQPIPSGTESQRGPLTMKEILRRIWCLSILSNSVL